MNTRKLFRRLVAMAKAEGCEHAEVVFPRGGHTHPRLAFTKDGERHWITVACSPKNERTALTLSRWKLRGALRGERR